MKKDVEKTAAGSLKNTLKIYVCGEAIRQTQNASKYLI